MKSTIATIAHGNLPKLQQAHPHDEDGQHDENARDNVLEEHRVPLEGACASDSIGFK